MKILEICPFSAGICGVWARVREESVRLSSRGHKVLVLSSNLEKGTNKIVGRQDKIDNVIIKRFPARKLGGESFMNFDFTKDALEFNPEVIIAHNYRHIHTLKSLNLAKKIRRNGKKCKVFLVTHAPFVEGNITRSLIAKWTVNFYDLFIGPATLKKFDKIFPISNWEIPFLIQCGAQKEQIYYIPNGIPEEFFESKPKRGAKNSLLFLGRVAPKKKIETLIEAISLLKKSAIKVEVVGPQEKDYYQKLADMVKLRKLENKISFLPPIVNLKEKISKIDSSQIFILPSRVEGMPQALIEAMARERIVIGSDSMAIRDLIKNKKNGYLFNFDDPHSLAKTIKLALKENKKNIGKNARKSVEIFSWNNVIKQIGSKIK